MLPIFFPISSTKHLKEKTGELLIRVIAQLVREDRPLTSDEQQFLMLWQVANLIRRQQ